jgi:flagellar M-ring protein FliF
MPPFLEQAKRQLLAIPVSRRISMLAVLIAAGVGLQYFVGWQKDRGFKPIYSGLGAEDAGQVTQRLKEGGIEYRLSENGSSILVPEQKIPELRLEMANAGIPRTGRIGFELFDKTSFGATDFAEHVNYRRAVEGELERSVMSLAEVENARVHVTFPKDSIYTETRQPAKASVLLKLRTGVTLSAQSVGAVTHLVASAVENLSPGQVSVLDMRGRLLNKPRRAGNEGEEASEATLELQQRIEKELLGKIQSTLSPLLGEEKFRAAVSVECDRNSGEENSEVVDPDKSVLLSSQSTTDSGKGASGGGVPGPSATPPSAVPPTAATTTRKTESNTYQNSKTVRHIKLAQGAITSLSISILMDQEVRWEKKDGAMQRVLVPPSPETIKIIRELITGVSGFKKDRGDQLIVESLPFESTVNAPPPEEKVAAKPVTGNQTLFQLPATPEQAIRDPRMLGAVGGLVLVLAMCVFFVRRRIKQNRKKKLAAALATKPIAGGADSHPLLSGSNLDKHAAGGGAVGSLEPASNPDLIEMVRREVVANPAMFAGVIEEWLAETGAK